MLLGWRWSSQTETVDSTSAHIGLGKEDVGAVLVLLIVASHIHSSSESENFLCEDAFAHSGHKLVTIKAYRLTFELD